LGKPERDKGQSLVPDPPHRMTGITKAIKDSKQWVCFLVRKPDFIGFIAVF